MTTAIAERTKAVDIIRPIFNMGLKKEEILMFEDVIPDVENLMMKSVYFLENGRWEQCLKAVEMVLELTWEELNTGHWSSVPYSQHVVFTAASLIQVVGKTQMAVHVIDDTMVSYLREAVRSADLGLMMGSSHRRQLTSAAWLLSRAINILSCKCYPDPRPVVHQFNANNNEISDSKLQVPTEPVHQLHSPSLQTFSVQYFHPAVPVKITGCMSEWPALKRWKDVDYLLEIAGARTVPVELGTNYSDADFGQRLMTLKEFITDYLNDGKKGLGYLAQHQLFDQVPELRKDILVPDYCACSTTEAEAEVNINAWLGPAGTVSPLHHDPKHNLLCQVLGQKRVLLYPTSVSEQLYPHSSTLLFNTARVDPEAPNYKLFPTYREAQALLCTLSPGEMLYIPQKWWHHVRALDTSFSVSFWWE